MIYKILTLIVTLFLFFVIENFLPYYENRTFKKRIIYSIQNIIIALLNGILTFFIFSFLYFKSYNFINNNSLGIINLFKMHYTAEVIIGFLLLDLWTYFWHFINHNSKFLWRFHRAHHSDIEMDSTTAIRFHTGEIIMSSILKIPVFILIGINPLIVIIHEITLNILTIFHHSNINLPESIDRILRTVIVTPNMHRVHHSQVMEETNSNYTSIFSVWDRLFRTFRINNDTMSIKLGLKEFVDDKWQNLWGIIKTPSVNV